MAISKASYDAAGKIRRDTTAQIDQIRNRRELTDAAKLSRIAKVHLAGAAQMKELQTTSVQTAKAQRAQAETRAFGVADLKGGSASLAISYRDALDRAAQLTSSKDAQALLSRAHRSGDEPLARATASHAFDMATSGASFTDSGWEDVVNNFLEQRPDLSDDVQTLAALARPTRSATELFAYVIPAPPELSGIGEYRIAALAEDDGTHAA